jgi:hypothetical protein
MSKTSRVNVAVRIRPLLPEETQKGYENCITVGKTESAQFVELKNPRSSFPEVPRFTFDSCYGVECGQGPIYENEVAPLIGSVFAGINTTVLAYGITGAGKTHTMQVGYG